MRGLHLFFSSLRIFSACGVNAVTARVGGMNTVGFRTRSARGTPPGSEIRDAGLIKDYVDVR